MNTEALLGIVPILYVLEDQERFNMSHWAAGRVNLNADSVTECGTQFCVAGAKARHDGWVPVIREEFLDGESVWVATGDFVPYADRHLRYREESESHRDAEGIAQDAFELDDDQSVFLFHCTHVSRVSDLERRIQWLVDGSSPGEFPDLFVDEERRHASEDAARVERMEERADF